MELTDTVWGKWMEIPRCAAGHVPQKDSSERARFLRHRQAGPLILYIHGVVCGIWYLCTVKSNAAGSGQGGAEEMHIKTSEWP